MIKFFNGNTHFVINGTEVSVIGVGPKLKLSVRGGIEFAMLEVATWPVSNPTNMSISRMTVEEFVVLLHNLL